MKQSSKIVRDSIQNVTGDRRKKSDLEEGGDAKLLSNDDGTQLDDDHEMTELKSYSRSSNQSISSLSNYSKLGGGDK